MIKISVLNSEKNNCGVLVPFWASFGASPPDVRVESGGALWMFSACFWPEQGFGNSAHGSYGNLGKQTCMSACESIQFLFIFVLRGLGFRV